MLVKFRINRMVKNTIIVLLLRTYVKDSGFYLNQNLCFKIDFHNPYQFIE